MTGDPTMSQPLNGDTLDHLSDRAAARGPRLLLIIAALWVINSFDAALTLTAHRQGILYEMNPVGDWFLRLGADSLILFKLAMVLMGTSLLWRMRAHALTELAAWVLLCAYVAVALQWHRCYEYYIALGDMRLVQRPTVHL